MTTIEFYSLVNDMSINGLKAISNTKNGSYNDNQKDKENKIKINIRLNYTETSNNSITPFNIRLKKIRNIFYPFKKEVTIFLRKEQITERLDIILNKFGNNNDGSNIFNLEFEYFDLNIEIKYILDAIEIAMNPYYVIDYNHDNIIQYLEIFTLFDLYDRQSETISQLLRKLTNENLCYFIKYVNSIYEKSIIKPAILGIISNKTISDGLNGNILYDDKKFSIYFLMTYSYWLTNYLILKISNIGVYNLDKVKFDNYYFNKIVKFDSASFMNLFRVNNLLNIEKDNLTFNQYSDVNQNDDRNIKNIIIPLKIYKQVRESLYSKYLKYYRENEYFNTGKIRRWKTEDNLIDDYPHYFSMILDNDPDNQLYAMRASENGNFIISKDKNNFNKFCEDYIGEIEANFLGTKFEIFDNGYDKNIIFTYGNHILKERTLLGSIIYETNIMGECPRYFRSELLKESSIFHLKNLEPEWNLKMNCYCLNFYGRVKKASARNFQMIFEDDPENIILQHGKESTNEFNIDFREPFNYVTAFAHSLVSIGSKRIVS